MREDIAQCGAAIYQKGFPWGMVTNALFLTPQKFNDLLRLGLHAMTISMDGLGEATGCEVTSIALIWFRRR